MGVVEGVVLGEEKKTVSWAGDSEEVVREMVQDIEGLWYFIRRSWLRQNTLDTIIST